MGYFIYWNIDFTNFTSIGVHEAEVFTNMILSNFLYQPVHEPTRGNTIVDLALTNKDNFTGNLELGRP